MGQTWLRWLACLIAMLAVVQVPVQAQTAGGTMEIKFVGTITGSAADTLMLRGADGTSTPWTGPLPDYPYLKGDQVTITMNVRPSGEYLDPNYPRKPADGIYHFSVIGASQMAGLGTSTGIAPISALDVSGPIGQSGQWQSSTGMEMTYNSNTGQWNMNVSSTRFTLFEFDGPGYSYDPATNSMALTGTTRQPVYSCGDLGNGCFGFSGNNLTDLATTNIPVWGTDGSLRGIFNLLFSGDWFLNGVKQGGGGSTQVPEPGQLALMAMALLPLVARRRKRMAAA